MVNNIFMQITPPCSHAVSRIHCVGMLHPSLTTICVPHGTIMCPVSR